MPADHGTPNTADDERRAEIEAVVHAEAERLGYRRGEFFDDHIAIVLAVLDRVRDARGDDEWRTPVVRDMEAEIQRLREELRLTQAARSPQDEDHEAGIDAAVLAWHRACKDDERLNLRGALAVAIGAYRSRVSSVSGTEPDTAKRP